MKRFFFTAPLVERIEERMLQRHETQEEVRKYIFHHPDDIPLTVVAETPEEAVLRALQDYDDMGFFPNTLYG